MKRFAFRSLIAALLVLGGSIAIGASRADAQWNTSPEPPPIACSSWQTAHTGGLCRVEHFNAAASTVPAGPSIRVQPGQGLTGISPGSSTNTPTITSGGGAGSGSDSTSGSAGPSGAAAGAAGASGTSDSGPGGAGGAGSAGASGGAGSGGGGGGGAAGSTGP